jgi:hypothetical protein
LRHIDFHLGVSPVANEDARHVGLLPCILCGGGTGHSGGRLKFFNTHMELADKRTFKKFLAPLRRIKWVVYCKEPFAGPQ